MTESTRPSTLYVSLRLVMAPPHPAANSFVAGGVAATVVGLLFWHPLGWLGLAFTVFALFFFRDPPRVPPEQAGVVLAAADGKVTSVTQIIPPAALELGAEPRWRVSIFLSVLNVHVNRIPVSGVVTRVVYHPGAFLNAALDKASEDNERNAVVIRLQDGRDMAVVQIAGWIARRILCDVRAGDVVRAGERFGIIRFGSRTDLYLPPGARPLVHEGQTMVGGETVIAVLPPAIQAPDGFTAAAAQPDEA